LASDFLDLPLRDFIHRLGAIEPGPRAGSAAAAIAAMSASLVALTARLARSWDDAAGAAAQADTLRERLERLVTEDFLAYAEAMLTLRAPEAGAGRDAQIGAALARAADVPAAIAEHACDVAQLAAVAAERGHADVRADAAAAAGYAAAAAQAAAHLVEVNLASRPDDERLRRVRKAVAVAAEAADRALAREA
jgi:formiminotetrahydrofolate cyclodeaminase